MASTAGAMLAATSSEEMALKIRMMFLVVERIGSWAVRGLSEETVDVRVRALNAFVEPINRLFLTDVLR